MPTASGRMKFLITFKMATSSRRFRHRFSHIFTLRTTIAWRVNNGGRWSSAIQCRTDDWIADDTSALTGAHHATIVFGRPGFPVVVEFPFVKTSSRRHWYFVVIILGTIENVALDAQNGLFSRKAIPTGR